MHQLQTNFVKQAKTMIATKTKNGNFSIILLLKVYKTNIEDSVYCMTHCTLQKTLKSYSICNPKQLHWKLTPQYIAWDDHFCVQMNERRAIHCKLHNTVNIAKHREMHHYSALVKARGKKCALKDSISHY